MRSALALSMITGQPFQIAAIRANRTKPGLMRQHLVAVQAAAQVSAASVAGAELGSSELSFTPGPIKGGDYHLAIAVVAIDFERGARRNTCVMKSTCQAR